VYFLGDGKWSSNIEWYGTGDVFRIYDSTLWSSKTVNGGGFLGLTVDGTHATGNSSGVHVGDIFKLKFDVGVQNFFAGTTSKGIWFDNQYSWCEQMEGEIFAQNCTQHVVFDNTANTSGNATGSYDRMNLNIFINQNGTGSGQYGSGSGTLTALQQVNDGPYVIQSNRYDSSAAFTVDYTIGLPTTFSVAASSLANTHPGSPAAYPSVYVGNQYGSLSPLNPFPLVCSSITPGQVVVSNTVTLGAGGSDIWDCVHDHWINTAPDPTNNATNGLEVMVWMANSTGVTPPGTLYASNVTIGANTFDVYWQSSWANATEGTASFQFTSQVTTATVDMYYLIQYMITQGWCNSAWYLIDCQAGFEIWQGGSGLVMDSFTVSNANGHGGDGVVFQNGALAQNAVQLGIFGNFSTSTTQYAVLRITGNNTALAGPDPGYSFISDSTFNIGVELDDATFLAPYTIYFGATGNYSFACGGLLSFAAGAYPFTASNKTSNFGYYGQVLGDSVLASVTNIFPTQVQTPYGLAIGNYAGPTALTANGQTIPTSVSFVPVTAAAAYTGLILATAGTSGQMVTVVNQSANALTFAAAGTSNVADGTADVIPALSSRQFFWDTNTSLWYGPNAENITGSAGSFTGSLAGDVTGTQGATTVGKVQGVAITSAEATLVSDLNNATARTATATLLPGEETVFTGSTTGQTLTLPASPPGSSINTVTNAASVSVTLAPGSGATLSNFGTSGNIAIPAGYTFAVVYIGTTWYVQSAGPSDFAKNNALAIANGGTGAITAAAAYNALSPMTTTGDLEYESGAGTAARLAGNTAATKKFLTQTGTGSASAAPGWGTIASGDLPAATTSAQGAVELDGTAADIQPLGTQAAGATGKAADAGHVHPGSVYIPSLPGGPYTGGTVAVDVFPGPTIAGGSIAAGQTWELDLWGTVTTTVDTQTLTWQVFYGGLAGTSLVSSGAANPNAGAAVTGAAMRYSAIVQFLSTTEASVTASLYMNYFLTTMGQQLTTVVTTGAEQMMVGMTPSAAGVSVTINGGCWKRVN
jgi:hypothetical protein